LYREFREDAEGNWDDLVDFELRPVSRSAVRCLTPKAEDAKPAKAIGFSNGEFGFVAIARQGVSLFRALKLNPKESPRRATWII